MNSFNHGPYKWEGKGIHIIRCPFIRQTDDVIDIGFAYGIPVVDSTPFGSNVCPRKFGTDFDPFFEKKSDSPLISRISSIS